jgi:hypothetical protein
LQSHERATLFAEAEHPAGNPERRINGSRLFAGTTTNKSAHRWDPESFTHSQVIFGISAATPNSPAAVARRRSSVTSATSSRRAIARCSASGTRSARSNLRTNTPANRISAAYISAGRVIAARHTSKSDKDAAPTLASRRPVRTSRDSAEATSAAAKFADPRLLLDARHESVNRGASRLFNQDRNHDAGVEIPAQRLSVS